MPSPPPNALSLSSPLIAQHHRLLRLDSPLGKDILLRQRVGPRDRLSQSYGHTGDLLATHTGIALEQLISWPVTLWVRQTTGDYLPVCDLTDK